VANEEAAAASARLLLAREELSAAASQLTALRRVEGELRHDLELSQDEARHPMAVSGLMSSCLLMKSRKCTNVIPRDTR